MYDPFHAQREAVKRWRKNNPDKVREAQKRWRDSNRKLYNKTQDGYRQYMIDHHPEKYLYDRVKNRAKSTGVEFTIALSDIVIPEACPLLNILIFYEVGKGQNPHAPSLDRIDNSKGYVPGNVWVISKKANTMKSNASMSELKEFCKNVLEKL